MIPLLVITGTVGVGKSAVLDEIHNILRAAEIPHACLDLDALAMSWPERGRFNRDVVLGNLEILWANFRRVGAERLVLATVLEEPEDLSACANAIACAKPTVCQLTTAESIRSARLRSREIGAGLEWHLQRTVELQRILDARSRPDFIVTNDDRPIREVGLEILERAGWPINSPA
ncbi:MAG TPA: hypothetical protein VES88_10215 [Gemmatimonadaceae bacterium]|nr:hypothetical protein [Gemmatimonadaceae bacterium]